MHFTSEINAYGVITNLWVAGDPYTLNIDPGSKEGSSYEGHLAQKLYKKYAPTSHCSHDSYMDCVSSR